MKTETIHSCFYKQFHTFSTNTSGDQDLLRLNDESPHGISLVSLLPGSINFSSLQLAHAGTTVLHMDPSTHQTTLVDLKLERCNGTITWSTPKSINVSFQKTKEISAGLKMKYTTTCKENITYLDEGFIDMVTLKTIELGALDTLTVPQQTLADISSCFKVSCSSQIFFSFTTDTNIFLLLSGPAHSTDTDIRIISPHQQAGNIRVSHQGGSALGLAPQ